MLVVWSSDAKADFRGALDWLDERNPRAADRLELDIEVAVQMLSRHPTIGRPSTSDGVRLLSLVKWHRRIAYEIRSGTVYIIAMKHTRQSGDF